MAAMENTLPPLDDLHLHDHQYQMAQLKATGQGQGQGQADGPADRSMAQGSNVNSRHNSVCIATSFLEKPLSSAETPGSTKKSRFWRSLPL